MCKDMFSKAHPRLSLLSSWEAGCPASSIQLPLPVPGSSAYLSHTGFQRGLYPLNRAGPLLLMASVSLALGSPGIVSMLTSGKVF